MEQVFTKEELKELEKLSKSKEVKAGARALSKKYNNRLSPEAEARKKARSKLYRLRHLYKVGKVALNGETT